MTWKSCSSVPLACLAVTCVLAAGCDNGGPDCHWDHECSPGQHCEGELCLPGSCIESATRPCFDGPPETRGVGACTDGTQTCTAGEWGECLGQVLPGTETCNSIDDDCDEAVDNAYDADTNPPCSTTETYFLSGDSGSDHLTVTGTTERWFRVRFREDSSSSRQVTGMLELRNSHYSVPAFDMYVYCESCGGAQVAYAAPWRSVNLYATDSAWSTDSFNVLVEIRFRDIGYGYCDDWTVAVAGFWLSEAIFTPINVPGTCG